MEVYRARQIGWQTDGRTKMQTEERENKRKQERERYRKTEGEINRGRERNEEQKKETDRQTDNDRKIYRQTDRERHEGDNTPNDWGRRVEDDNVMRRMGRETRMNGEGELFGTKQSLWGRRCPQWEK